MNEMKIKKKNKKKKNKINEKYISFEKCIIFLSGEIIFSRLLD